MAGPFCLNHKQADDFKKAILEGEINPEKLTEMSSRERRDFFAERFGEHNAEPMNRLLETKLLLKNQQQGMINWASKLLGTPKQVKRDIISRIERMDNVLNPAEESAFLEDLASHRLGTHVSYDEAKAITDLSNKVTETKSAMESGGDRLDYGRAQVELLNYVTDLKKQAVKTTLADIRNRPAGTIAKAVTAAPGVMKSIQAAFDNSALFRQGWKTLMTNPLIWQKNARKSFLDIYNTFRGKDVNSELQADILSRPNADLYKRMKLDVGNMEEAFPTSLPEKIPLIGRAYKASENAYTGFLHKTRADIADKMLDIAKKNDVDLNDTELVNIGRLVNSLTGRGNLGHAERALSTINTVFFSPRNVKAHIDTLMQPITGGATLRETAEGATGSNFVRKEAAKNLVKTVAGTVAILAIAKALKPDSVDNDPRSADFGKIKIGNTRFDVTGGMGSLLVLFGKLLSGQSKSSVTGKVSDIRNPQYGGENGWDVLVNFFSNKLSPMMSIGKDFIKGETFEGKQPTVAGEALSAFTPLPLKTFTELLNDPEAKKDKRFVAFAQAMDMLGMSTNTYTKRPGGPKQPDVDFNKMLKSLGDALK